MSSDFAAQGQPGQPQNVIEPVSQQRPSSAREFMDAADKQLKQIDTKMGTVVKETEGKITDLKSMLLEVGNLEGKVREEKTKLKTEMVRLAGSFTESPMHQARQFGNKAVQQLKQTSAGKIGMVVAAAVFSALFVYALLTLLVDSLKDKRPEFLKEEDGIMVAIAIASGFVPLGVAAILYMKRRSKLTTVGPV